MRSSEAVGLVSCTVVMVLAGICGGGLCLLGVVFVVALPPTVSVRQEARETRPEPTPVSLQTGPHPEVTRANYERIQRGMTRAEVEEILGPGEETASAPGVQMVAWHSRNLFAPIFISITFQNGRAEAKAIN